MTNPDRTSIDISFSVPFTHRLRVTHDVCGEDFAQLLGVLERGDAGPAKVLLITEQAVFDSAENVRSLPERLRQHADVDVVADTMTLVGGEAIKNTSDPVHQILGQINQHNLDRRSYIIAIGGGALLDAVGYAAATAHRGIRLVRLPTTTLAQADSGVGVKNAINYFGKKNWVGTFAVPWAVINDTKLLETLPDRDFRSGFSEAVKVSLLKDGKEFDWLCDNAGSIRDREMTAATGAIHRSCMLHLQHITAGGDPFEMLEARPLDFGHWSAHKLEPTTNYEIRHGEAVAIGVAIDCIYSAMKLGLEMADARRVCQCLHELGLPLWHDALNPIDRLLEGLEEFRQHLGGRLTITMLQGVGKGIDVHEIDSQAMQAAIERLRGYAHDLQGCGVAKS